MAESCTNAALLAAGGREHEARRVLGHAIGQGADAEWKLLRKGLSVGSGRLAILTAIAATAVAAKVIAVVAIIVTASGAGSVVAALVSLHATADGLGRDASTDLNVWLLDDEARLDGSAAASTILGSKHPLAVSLCELGNGNDANAGLVITAVTRAETNTPTGLCLLA